MTVIMHGIQCNVILMDTECNAFTVYSTSHNMPASMQKD